MKKIGWGLIGAGDFLLETFNVVERLKGKYRIASYLSEAGERTVHIYGLWNRLVEICPGGYYGELVRGSSQGASFPLSGRFQRARHQALIISPASGNTVLKIVTGIADTLVTNSFAQAGKGGIPILLVPTDQESKKISHLPHVVHRKICRRELGSSYEECKVLDVCPYNAISSVEGAPKIDLTKCGGCGVCLENCPYGAITFGEETEVNLRRIDLENVEKLKKLENTHVVEDPEKISKLLEDLLE